MLGGRTPLNIVYHQAGTIYCYDRVSVTPVYGARRFHAHVGAVMVVHLAFATLLAQSECREGTYGTMKLSPIAQAPRDMTRSTAPVNDEPATV